MTDHMTGCLARSLAGHDKDTIYVIVKESAKTVHLVDGRIRTLDRPKCKKKKHIQIINITDETLSKKLIQELPVTDEEIKYFIKCYEKKINQ